MDIVLENHWSIYEHFELSLAQNVVPVMTLELAFTVFAFCSSFINEQGNSTGR